MARALQFNRRAARLENNAAVYDTNSERMYKAHSGRAVERGFDNGRRRHTARYISLTMIQAKPAARRVNRHRRQYKSSYSRDMSIDRRSQSQSKGARHLLVISGIAVSLSGMEDNDALLVTLLARSGDGSGMMLAYALAAGIARQLSAAAGQDKRPLPAPNRDARQCLLHAADALRNLRTLISIDYPAGMMLANAGENAGLALAGGLARFGNRALAQIGRDWRNPAEAPRQQIE